MGSVICWSCIINLKFVTKLLLALFEFQSSISHSLFTLNYSNYNWINNIVLYSPEMCRNVIGFTDITMRPCLGPCTFSVLHCTTEMEINAYIIHFIWNSNVDLNITLCTSFVTISTLVQLQNFFNFNNKASTI